MTPSSALAFFSELTHPYYIIKDAGYSIDLASPLGGPAPIDPEKSQYEGPRQSALF